MKTSTGAARSIFVSMGVLAALLLVLALDAWGMRQTLVRARGRTFDFDLVWVGSREWWEGRTPYTDAVARTIQRDYLGHTAQAGENEYRFVYPAFIALLLFPLPLLPFEWAVSLWLVALQAAAIGAVFLSLRALDYKPRPVVLGFILLDVVFLRYVWLNLLLAQLTLAVLVCLVGAGYLAQRGRSEWSGVVLALALFKPQLALIPTLGWLTIMVAQREWRALVAWSGTVGLLLVLPMLRTPAWVWGFWSQVSMYNNYNDPSSTLTVLTAGAPPFAATLVTALGAAVAGAGIVAYGWVRRAVFPTLALGALLTVLVVPLSWSYDLALLLMPWLAALAALGARPSRLASALMLLLIAVPLASWLINFVPDPLSPEALDKLALPLLVLAAWVYALREPAPLERPRAGGAVGIA